MKKRVQRWFQVLGQLFYKRVLWIMAFAVLFGALGYQFDRYKFDKAPSEQFVQYYDFSVNNARAGDDVFFKVCRRHDELYNYNGNLTVYIVPNTNDTSQNVKVYSQALGGTLKAGDCENKVIKPSNFSHKPGNYTMGFCISFKVKYDFEKRACKDSNVYTIYPQPEDAQAQIKYYQDQIDALMQQQADNTQPLDLYAGPALNPSTEQRQQRSSTPVSPTQPAPTPSAVVTPLPVPAPTPTPCTLRLLGICVLG